jgi:hypothetical protein
MKAIRKSSRDNVLNESIELHEKCELEIRLIRHTVQDCGRKEKGMEATASRKERLALLH